MDCKLRQIIYISFISISRIATVIVVKLFRYKTVYKSGWLINNSSNLPNRMI